MRAGTLVPEAPTLIAQERAVGTTKGGESMNAELLSRARGCAVGAAVGDALGMPLEFGLRQPPERLVRDMRAGRVAAGTFTDDTEMALVLADSLLRHRPLDPGDLAQRFVAWLQAGPDDVGNHTRSVLARIDRGQPWEAAIEEVQRRWPDSAGNGSVMRCWPVALVHWSNLALLLDDSRLQSRVTHPHSECQAGSAFVNAAIHFLMQRAAPEEAVTRALEVAAVPAPLRDIIVRAPAQARDRLANTGWVRHTLESAAWGLLTTDSFEEAVVQVVNLGQDADTAGAVVGALAGAAYGLEAIPARWRDALRGEWPLGSRIRWTSQELAGLAERLIGSTAGKQVDKASRLE